MYEVVTAPKIQHIQGIWELQKLNLKENLSLEEIESEGFVTCNHSLELLEKMNFPYPHICVLYQNRVVAYALVMLPILRNDIDVLVPMFEKIDILSAHENLMSTGDYFVMGQICIAKDHRSKGLFQMLYNKMKEQMSPNFKYCITEIATDNYRSRRAHEKVGFKEWHSYIDPQNSVSWELVIWDWE